MYVLYVFMCIVYVSYIICIYILVYAYTHTILCILCHYMLLYMRVSHVLYILYLVVFNGMKDIYQHIRHNISYHIQAARILFNSKNEQSALLSGHIDLHGLHVSEALDMLSELLPIYCHILYNTTTPPPGFNKLLYTRIISQCLPYVYIITGTGHHTKGQSGTGTGTGTVTGTTSNVKGDGTVETKSRLFTAVDQYLSEWQLTYSVVADSKGYGGAFRISTGS